MSTSAGPSSPPMVPADGGAQPGQQLGHAERLVM